MLSRSIFFSIIFFSVTESSAQIAIKADTVYTMAGQKIINGIVLLKDGKIEAVGTGISIPANYQVFTTKVVTPGLIDVRSTVGFSGAMNTPADQNQLEKSGPIQPDLRAIDAYDPEDKLVEHTGHGLGALVSGQTMIVKTRKGITDEVTVKPLSMLAMTIGPGVSGNFSSPGTKAKQIAMLRTELLKTQAAMKTASKDSSKPLDLRQQIIEKLLKGEIKGLISANTAVDIMSAIRLSKEFNFKLVIEGAAEAYRLIDQIKAAKAEVIVHATMARMGTETLHMTMENAAILSKAGIPVSIESGFEGYVPKTRVVLYEAAVAMANGLPYEDALRAITINPAKLLGIDKQVGSLEKGKDADLVLFNGDPFEYTTKVCMVIINGKVEFDNNCKN
jgi:imidazolonepropionase-like amidohydrolase